MSAFAIAAISFVCAFGGAMVGFAVSSSLPDHHRSGDSRDVIKLAVGMIATLSALVLGLLVATAKGTFDEQNHTVNQVATKVILLDRILGWYGPESAPARTALRGALALTVEHLWPEEPQLTPQLAPGEAHGRLEHVYEKIAALQPENDAQRTLKSEALAITTTVAEMRLQLFVLAASSLPTPFLVVLTFWMTVLFFGYGVLSHSNRTVGIALCVCAMSVAGAVFLVVELSRPFDGIVRIDRDSLQDAVAQLGH